MNYHPHPQPRTIWVALALSLLCITACSAGSPSQDNASDSKRSSSESTSTASASSTDSKQGGSKQTEAENKTAPTTDRPYINSLLPEARRIQKEYGIPIDTTVAIAIHETGWGKYEIGQNNHFGLRCASDDCITLSKGGANIEYETCPDEAECFNMFAESITELSNGQPGDLRVIYKNGYATSSSWVRKVRNIRRQVRKTLKKAGISPTE